MTIFDPITGKLVAINVLKPMHETQQEPARHLNKVRLSQRGARNYRIHRAATSL
jgi:hypothetical protein